MGKYLLGKVLEAAAVALGTACANGLYCKVAALMTPKDITIDGDFDESL